MGEEQNSCAERNWSTYCFNIRVKTQKFLMWTFRMLPFLGGKVMLLFWVWYFSMKALISLYPSGVNLFLLTKRSQLKWTWTNHDTIGKIQVSCLNKVLLNFPWISVQPGQPEMNDTHTLYAFQRQNCNLQTHTSFVELFKISFLLFYPLSINITLC